MRLPNSLSALPAAGAVGGRWPATPAALCDRGDPAHIVQFYAEDAFLAESVADFLATGLTAGQPALVIATAAHEALFVDALLLRGVDVDAAIADGRLVCLDARRTLGAIMRGPLPDARRAGAVLGRTIERSARRHGGRAVRVYGEMVDLLWQDGNLDGAVALEACWNGLAARHRFVLLCAYPMRGFAEESHAAWLHDICGHHEHVLPTEHFAQVDERDRLREVVLLQQRARALESELASRRRLEAELRDALAERALAEAAACAREEELKRTLENAVEAIHWVDADGTIEWANGAELAMLGYEATEYVGRPIAAFHVDAGVIADMFDRLTRGGSLHDHAARLRHRDGSERDVRINANGLWRDGRLVRTCCFTRDVTERQRDELERERLLAREREARAEAEAANRAKSDFLAVMSHELRTPLNAIAGYAELIEMGVRGPVSSAQREDLARIQKSQRHLLGLINEVLNYTRVDSGAVSYDLTDVAVTQVLAGAETLVAPQLAARGLTLDATADPSLVVRADVDKARQVLLNLLSNAVKFTEPGGRIAVTCEPLAEGRVAVRVRDTGIGIATDQLDRIFEPFVQVNASLTRTQCGTGLGLAISRDLARGMGGDLTVTSDAGRGSEFTFTLPGAPLRAGATSTPRLRADRA